MGDICISLSAVKPGFLPAAKALDSNGDDKVCKSENSGISDKDFEAFVNMVRNAPEVKGSPSIDIPEMIDIPDISGKRIMKGELTVGLFKQVMAGYEITDYRAGELIALLADDSKAGEALTYVSLNDAREFAKRLSELTGRRFRVQTEAEWLAARNGLSGNNWTWTETEHFGAFGLRRLVNDLRIDSVSIGRYDRVAVRLVEDF